MLKTQSTITTDPAAAAAHSSSVALAAEQAQATSIPIPCPFISNIHSVEAYLLEIESHWPAEFRWLCIKDENSEVLIDYIRTKLEKGQISTKDVQFLLLCTAYYGTVQQVIDLVDQAFVDAFGGTEDEKITIMHMAALRGDVRLIASLQRLNVPTYQKADFGPYKHVTPLHCVVVSGNLDALKLFTRLHFDTIHYKLGEGATDYIELGCLALAVFAGQIDIFRHLLENDYRERIAVVQAGFGGNILHIAVESFQADMLRALLSHDCFRHKSYLEYPNTYGLTPFALAAQLGNTEGMRILKEKDAQFDMPTNSDKFHDYTPLHLAVDAAQSEAVEMLLGYGANVDAECKSAMTNDEGEPSSPLEEKPKTLAKRRAKEAAAAAKQVSSFDLRQRYNRQAMRYRAISVRLTDFAAHTVASKFEPTTDRKVVYKNLVFKGGGPKGMVYAGALLQLLEQWDTYPDLQNLSSIERVAGTSAGAITAALLAVGMTPAELRDLLLYPAMSLALCHFSLADIQVLQGLVTIFMSQANSASKIAHQALADKIQGLDAARGSYRQVSFSPEEVEFIRAQLVLNGQKDLSEKLAPNNDPKQFLEGHSLDLLGSKSVPQKVAHVLGTAGWYTLHPLQMGGLLWNLCTEESICTGDAFLAWIEVMIKAYTGIDYCTFGELKQLVDRQKERNYRHLHVVTIRVSPNTQIEVLSSEDDRYKDYTIAHAIRASMSIPVLFKPAALYQTVCTAAGKRDLKKVDEGMYVDGGILANYPVKLFDTAGFVHQGLYLFPNEMQKRFPVYNERTLGFYIKSEKSLEQAVYVKVGKLSMKSALTVLYESAEDRIHEFEQAGRRTVAIDNAGVTLFDFDLKQDQLAALIEAGKEAVRTSSLITHVSRETIVASATGSAAALSTVGMWKKSVEGRAAAAVQQNEKTGKREEGTSPYPQQLT